MTQYDFDISSDCKGVNWGESCLFDHQAVCESQFDSQFLSIKIKIRLKFGEIKLGINDQ